MVTQIGPSFNAHEFALEFKKRAGFVDYYLDSYLTHKNFPVFQESGCVGKLGIQNLLDSIRYSACDSGKRFRPVLAMIVGESLNVPMEDLLPFCASLEMIHCYSLIHDDLPCMDNDDFRRGKATNHKVYGEDVALLAGDSLLTEAFVNLSEYYSIKRPRSLGPLVSELGRAAGLGGMIGGQAMDMYSNKNKQELFDEKSLKTMHYHKTGKLIEIAVVGVGLIAEVDSLHLEGMRNFGRGLGVAFQVADDLLDQDQNQEQHKSFVGLLGVDGAKNYLTNLNNELFKEADTFSTHSELLKKLILFNSDRQS